LSLIGGGVFFWYGLLASFSLQIASVASEHYGENKGGIDQWIRSGWLLKIIKINRSLLVKSSQISAGDMT